MNKRFRIALSYAGEKRVFVAEVARLLAESFGQAGILYDKFHQAEFARGDLAFTLPRLYHEESELIVAVLCSDYAKKEWCGLEWGALFGLLKKRRAGEVMLTRFDRVEGDGLYGLAGYVDLDELTPQAAVRLILQRLALNEGLDRDHYLPQAVPAEPPIPDFPAQAPPLDWPVADHTQARSAFAELITRSSKHRLLLVWGGSDTGKSLLTKQFLGNGLRIESPNLRVGRFDFKGGSDMDHEMRHFAEQLDVAPPAPGTGVSRQLAQLWAALREAPRPTLLIFDTFEMAGEADRWMRESLLLALVRAAWLRVVIVGQRVPRAHGEPWAGICAAPIELRAPSPEEWFAFGLVHKPGLTLEFVSQAHEFSEGNSTTLAQLLGPKE